MQVGKGRHKTNISRFSRVLSRDLLVVKENEKSCNVEYFTKSLFSYSKFVFLSFAQKLKMNIKINYKVKCSSLRIFLPVGFFLF